MNNMYTLIDLDLVSDCEWLHKYNEIISCGNIKEKYNQKHHIVPKSYYKHNKLSIDNSDLNIVYLHRADHILAHYYLALCAKSEWFRYSNAKAFSSMVNEYDMSIREKELINNLPYYEDVYKIYVDGQSERAKKRVGDKSTTGGRWSMYNADTDDLIFIKIEDYDYYKSLGYEHKGKPMSEDGKRKIGESNAISQKGLKRSDAAKLSISESLKARWKDPNNKWLTMDRTCSDITRKKHRESSIDRVDIIKDSNVKRVKIVDLPDYLKLGWSIKSKDKRIIKKLEEKCKRLGILI